MMGHQGQSLSLKFIIVILLSSVVVAENDTETTSAATIENGEAEKIEEIPQSNLKNEEFRLWIEEQENRVVQKIMDKISSPLDTSMQHEAKIAVAKYLVNVTFTAMTKRLETLKSGKRQSFIPATAALPSSALPATATTTVEPVIVVMQEEKNETQSAINSTTITSTQPPPPQEMLMFKGDGESNNDTASLPETSAGSSTISPEFPVSSIGSPGISPGFPASSTVEIITTTTNTTNESETTTVTPKNQKPLWEEILNFNFSAALMGGGDNGILMRLRGGEGQNLLSRLNLTGLRIGGDGGSLFDRLNLTALGGGNEGGSLFDRLNLTALGGGSGDGGSLFDRLNLTALRGGNGSLFDRLNLTAIRGGSGEGGSLFDRLNLTALGGGNGDGGSLFDRLNLTALRGGNGSLFDRLNLTALGGGNNGGGGGAGGIFSLNRFNLSSLGGGAGGAGGLLNRLNLTAASSEGGESGLPFNLPPPPEGLFNYPTPPPMNDSVRMSQMILGSQVEKLMGDINNTNLTGIVDSTLNIATPSTVGVLVNALLNILLCNPLDRFNGNCGIE